MLHFQLARYLVLVGSPRDEKEWRARLISVKAIVPVAETDKELPGSSSSRVRPAKKREHAWINYAVINQALLPLERS